MKTTRTLRERFTKDCKIPIKIYEDPYFFDRLKLYDRFYDTIENWEVFCDIIDAYDTEDDYLAEYSEIKDKAINYIKSSEAYKKFNAVDMNQFAISEEHRNLPHKDIYRCNNIGRKFVSLDMKKANFSCMRHYDPEIFGNAATWEDFIRMFTDNVYIISSKYIREVILGNCNCSRHITYEKYVMDGILSDLLERGVDSKHVVFFGNDEIVLDITDVDYTSQVTDILNTAAVPLRADYFTLRAAVDANKNNKVLGFIREMTDGTYEFKCFDHYTLPFIIRYLNDEPITENDLVFEFEGNLSKMLEIPEIKML